MVLTVLCDSVIHLTHTFQALFQEMGRQHWKRQTWPLWSSDSRDRGRQKHIEHNVRKHSMFRRKLKQSREKMTDRAVAISVKVIKKAVQRAMWAEAWKNKENSPCPYLREEHARLGEQRTLKLWGRSRPGMFMEKQIDCKNERKSRKEEGSSGQGPALGSRKPC